MEDTYHGVIATAPHLADRLDRAERVTPFKGTSKLANFYRRSFGPGWALVGDAAYHRGPLAGMGIGDAFLGAHERLARWHSKTATSLVSPRRAGIMPTSNVLFHLHMRVMPVKAGVESLPPETRKEDPAVLEDHAKRIISALPG